MSYAKLADQDLNLSTTQFRNEKIKDVTPKEETGVIHLKSLKKESFNILFIRRAYRILSLGLGSPLEHPLLWFNVAINIGTQIAGAYCLQTLLYILATGKDTVYPGLAGCLKSGCGGKKAPGSRSMLEGYKNDFAWMFILSMVLLLIFSLTGELINAAMRKNSAKYFQDRLLRNASLIYRLTINGNMDGIDQRITSDLQVVFDGFDCVLFGNLNDYLAYPVFFAITRIAASFSNAYSLEAMNDPNKKAQVFFVVIAAVVVAIVAYMVPMNHVSRFFYRGQKYEGDLRSTHTKMVLNCEQISTLAGEPTEKVTADKQFERVDKNNIIYYYWQSSLMFLRLMVALCIPAMSYVCLAICATSNSTTANFFQKQIGDSFEYFLYLPAMLERLAYAAGACHRVGQLLEQMDIFDAHPVKTNFEDSYDRIELKNVVATPPIPVVAGEMPQDGTDMVMTFASLCCDCSTNDDKSVELVGFNKTFEDRPLFQNVNLSVAKGQSVCIMGPSGCGKSSLLRVIGGLWGVQSGVVTKPSKIGKDGIFFLPQRPYVFPGTLAAQITYPDAPTGQDDVKIRSILAECHLSHLLAKYGLEVELDWDVSISISEMQRLNFARLFFAHPIFCLADECTSALGMQLESMLYVKCAKDYKITMISVAHRPTVVPHHDFVFKYAPVTHSWNLVPSTEVATCEKFPIDGFVEPPIMLSEEPVEAPEVKAGFNLQFLKFFYRAMKLAWTSCCDEILAFLFVMLVCMGIYGYLVIVIARDYGTGLIINQITGASKLVKKDIPLAFQNAGIIIGLNTVNAFVQSISALLGCMIALKMHRKIIEKFHAMYFSVGSLYNCNRVSKISGIDQKMVQDLAGFREAVGWLFGNPFVYFNYRVGFFPLTVAWLIMFSYMLYISIPLTMTFLIFIVGSYLIQIWAATITTPYVEHRQAEEGALRLHLGRVMANIESITFFKGQEQEANTADKLLKNVITSRMSYIYRATITAFPTIGMYYWLQTGVYVMATVLQTWWKGRYALNVTDLFTTIAFSIIWAKVTQLIIQCMGGFGTVAGFTHRVMETLERVEESNKHLDKNLGAIRDSANAISVAHVDISIPTKEQGFGKDLVKDLDVTVPAGSSLCVSGSTKSSVLRVLRGLWTPAAGEVARPALGEGVMFLPQSSYATYGTLAAQVCYPVHVDECEASEVEVASLLNEVGLGAIVMRFGLHTVVPWENVLSGGEMQRLNFARLLFQNPKFAVMDESTSSLDLALEGRCMAAVTTRNMSLLSIATRPSMRAYHQRNLHINLDGSHAEVEAEDNLSSIQIGV